VPLSLSPANWPSYFTGCRPTARNSVRTKWEARHDLKPPINPDRVVPHRTRFADEAENVCCATRSASHSGALHVRSDICVQRCHECIKPDCEETRDPDDLIKQAWTDSGKVYGYRKLHDDLLDQGETCSKNRVARLASLASIAAQIGYKRRPGRYGGKPAVVADNTLDRQFEVDAPDRIWVTDITYIRTHEGWSYLSVVIDLFSRRVVGWSMQSRMTTDLALQALLAAVWRRKPKQKVMVHSDQGSQFTSTEWQSFLNKHNLDASMSRRGNCHDNAVAESFFQLLKRERIRRQTYLTRDGRTCSTTSGCSTTRHASTRTTACCHQLTMK